MIPAVKLPKIYAFKKDADLAPYIIKQTFIASSFDVSLSELYHKTDKSHEVLIDGKEYAQYIKPYAYFKYKKKVWPIYNDDAGQQDMIYIDGEFIGGGAYNFNSIEEFVDIINYREFKNKESK